MSATTAAHLFINKLCLFVCLAHCLWPRLLHILFFCEWNEQNKHRAAESQAEAEAEANQKQLLLINQLSIYECVNGFLNTFVTSKPAKRCPKCPGVVCMCTCVCIGYENK